MLASSSPIHLHVVHRVTTNFITLNYAVVIQMPVFTRSNNRILPANTRAVDVARQAIRDITPVQQRRYHNAFMVQGYEAVVYNRLHNGLACSCQARRKTLASILDEDGKMPEGKMNELLTGGLEFSVNRYGATSLPSSDRSVANPNGGTLVRDDQFFGDLEDENQTPFEIAGSSSGAQDPYMDVTAPEGANGRVNDAEPDEDSPVFDLDVADLQGTRCTCCFGTGYVGGYSVLGGQRIVLAPHSAEVTTIDGVIAANRFPNAFWAKSVSFNVQLPRGFVNLDALRVWNNVDRVDPTSILIDNLPFSPQLLAALCDGRAHQVTVAFSEETHWTHLELQICLSRDPAYLEFPKLSQSSDISVQDLTESAQISASPIIPRLTTQDVIVESTFGKTFLIASSNWWNDKDRNVHGWDCQTRVIQPNELLSLLPRRRKLAQVSTKLVRDNVDGHRRT